MRRAAFLQRRAAAFARAPCFARAECFCSLSRFHSLDTDYPTTTGRQVEPTNAAASVGLGEQRLNANWPLAPNCGSKTRRRLRPSHRHLYAGTARQRAPQGRTRGGRKQRPRLHFGLLCMGFREDHCEHGLCNIRSKASSCNSLKVCLADHAHALLRLAVAAITGVPLGTALVQRRARDGRSTSATSPVVVVRCCDSSRDWRNSAAPRADRVAGATAAAEATATQAMAPRRRTRRRRRR